MTHVLILIFIFLLILFIVITIINANTQWEATSLHHSLQIVPCGINRKCIVFALKLPSERDSGTSELKQIFFHLLNVFFDIFTHVFNVFWWLSSPPSLVSLSPFSASLLPTIPFFIFTCICFFLRPNGLSSMHTLTMVTHPFPRIYLWWQVQRGWDRHFGPLSPWIHGSLLTAMSETQFLNWKDLNVNFCFRAC